MLFILKDMLDSGKSRVNEALEHGAFKRKMLSRLFMRGHRLFEREKAIVALLILD
jgi:hypothetical protein